MTTTAWDHPRFIGPLPESWYTGQGRWTGGTNQPWRCGSCDIRPTSKITSGCPECGYCWDWRKLNGPAAIHWFKVAALFLSNVDSWDWNNFMPEVVGVTQDEFAQALKTATTIRDTCKALLIEHHRTEEELDRVIKARYDAL